MQVHKDNDARCRRRSTADQAAMPRQIERIQSKGKGKGVINSVGVALGWRGMSDGSSRSKRRR